MRTIRPLTSVVTRLGSSINPPAKLPIKFHFGVLAFYLLVCVLVFNRLLLQLDRVVSAGPLNDYHLFLWNNWWIKHALFTLHTDPYFTDYVLFPYQHNLSIHTLAPIFAPFNWVFSPLLGNLGAMNAMMWLCYALTGYATFLFMRYCGGVRRVSAALVGGLLFTFLPAMMDHAINYHANMWPMLWIPIVMLVWWSVSKARGWRGGIVFAFVLGLCLWGLWMTDSQFLIWTPLLLVPYGFLTLARAEDNRQRGRLIVLGLIALAVMTALLLIAPLPALLKGEIGPTSPARYLTARAYSLPLSAFFFNPGEADRSIGRVIIVLAVAALFIRPRTPRPIRWFWLALSIPPLILSLGPDIQIGDQVIPLPYRLLHDALNGLYRYPSRFAPIGVLALLAFIGISFDQIRLSRRNSVTVLLVLAILIDGRLLAPFPVQDPLPDYAVYHEIGAEQGDYVILDVPVTVHSGWAQVGGDKGHRSMYYQTIHHKKQVNGSISRIPDIEHLFYQQSPLLGWFSASQPANVPAASEELSRFVREWPIGYVIVHLSWLDPTASLSILSFLNTHPAICFWKQERDLVVYRERSRGCAPLKDRVEIDFGQQGDEPYLLDGWYPRESIGGAGARWSRATTHLKITMIPGKDYEMTFNALGFGEDRRVTIRANDVEIGTVALSGDWTTHTLRIPAQAIGTTGVVTLTFAANGERSPSADGQSGDTRQLAAAYRSVRIVAVP